MSVESLRRPDSAFFSVIPHLSLSLSLEGDLASARFLPTSRSKVVRKARIILPLCCSLNVSMAMDVPIFCRYYFVGNADSSQPEHVPSRSVVDVTVIFSFDSAAISIVSYSVRRKGEGSRRRGNWCCPRSSTIQPLLTNAAGSLTLIVRVITSQDDPWRTTATKTRA